MSKINFDDLEIGKNYKVITSMEDNFIGELIYKYKISNTNICVFKVLEEYDGFDGLSLAVEEYVIEYSNITSIKEDEKPGSPVLKGGKRRKSIRRKN